MGRFRVLEETLTEACVRTMSNVEQLEKSMEELTEHVLSLHREREALLARIDALESELQFVRGRAKTLVLALAQRLLKGKTRKAKIPIPSELVEDGGVDQSEISEVTRKTSSYEVSP